MIIKTITAVIFDLTSEYEAMQKFTQEHEDWKYCGLTSSMSAFEKREMYWIDASCGADTKGDSDERKQIQVRV